jgi:hypothetical protein
MAYMSDTSSSADIIDTRDVIARVEHLRQLREPGAVDLGEDNATDQDTLFSELTALESLLSDLSGNGGDEQWEGHWYPVMLIRETYFKEYAMALAEDCGAINANATWPNNCIDWEKAARQLKGDYATTEYNGVTYYYRYA